MASKNLTMTTQKQPYKERVLLFLNEFNDSVINGTYSTELVKQKYAQYKLSGNILMYAIKANLFTIIAKEGRKNIYKSNHPKILKEHVYFVMQIKTKDETNAQKKRRDAAREAYEKLKQQEPLKTQKAPEKHTQALEIELIKNYTSCLNDIAKIHAFSVTHHIEYKAALERNKINSPYFTDAIVALGFYNPHTKKANDFIKEFEPRHGRMVMNKVDELCKEKTFIQEQPKETFTNETQIREYKRPSVVEVEKKVLTKVAEKKTKQESKNERTISIFWGLFKWTTKTR